MNTFTYNGQSPEEFGLRVESRNIFSTPEYAAEFTAIPGRSGDLIVSGHRFSNVTVSYTVFAVRGNIYGLADTLRAVKGWLYSEPDRYHEITDSYDPGYIRYGVISGALDIEEQMNRIGSFTVTFSCKPYKYSLAGLKPVTVENGGSLYNPEAFPSRPVIEITGAGDLSLTLQNGDYNGTWSFKGIEKGIVCDSKQMNFYYGATPLGGKVTGDGFPELPPGMTGITAGGNVTAIKIIPRWRCL